MRKLIEDCPSCEGRLVATRLSCANCDTEVTGRFRPSVFESLKEESLAFVETFVRLRGNIKEMERELGVPYTAVRGRLDEVIQELGFGGSHTVVDHKRSDTPPSGTRKSILDELEEGSIDADEAARRLKELG